VSSDTTKGAAPDPPTRGKIAKLLLPGGTEPDPRFTLANERTFLAWIRTSLALLAGGIAIEAFTADLFLEPVRKGLAVLLLLLGMMLSAGSAVRWLRVERSMRNRPPLPLPLVVPLMAATGALAATVVLVFILGAELMTPNRSSEHLHGDAGLQPERTTLAWGRTMMALVTASAIFRRWLPHHGLPILALFAVAVTAAAAIYVMQRRRYSTSSHGILQETINVQMAAVLGTAFTGIVLGILGIAVVLTS
jgi:putative membrane protein